MKRLTAAETDALADSIRTLLDAIRNGETAASSSTVHRLEGALVALETVAGRSTEDILGKLAPPS